MMLGVDERMYVSKLWHGAGDPYLLRGKADITSLKEPLPGGVFRRLDS